MAAAPPSALAVAARLPLALGAALALADASIVTLALPEILERLDTTIEGLAAVIGVYTLVLSAAVLVAVPLRRWLGSAVTGALGMLLFAVASVMCGVSDGLTGLLVSRGIQAVGAGLGLVAAYELLARGDRASRAARDRDAAADPGRPAATWVAAAIFGTAIGPALGGALTESFDWRAIFLAQAPFGLLAAAACLVPQGTASASSAGAAPSAGAGAGAPARQDAWPLPPQRPARSTARPAGHEDPTRVVGADADATLVDPAAGVRARPDGSAPTVRRTLEPPRPGVSADAAGPGPGPVARPGGPYAASGAPARRTRPTVHHARAAAALALVSAALTAVVFLLVLLLVTGWDVRPLKAAVGVTLLPVAAVAGWRIPGDPWLRASAGCALVGAGVLALAALPTVGAGWVALPQVLAGIGMGMALPALAGELLPERSPGQAAGLLSLRHVGITVALLALAPVIADRLDTTVERTREQVAALVLDAPLPPEPKLDAIGAALGNVSADDPRGSLRTALDLQAPRFANDADDRATYARLTVRADETIVTAVNGGFRTAFVITGALALLAALLALPPVGRYAALAAALAVAALVLAGGQALLAERAEPEPVVIADPCRDRDLPSSGGLDGFVQGAALKLLDRAACRFGSSREALALAIGDEGLAREYERRHGVDPRKEIPALLGGAVGGGDGEPSTLEKLVRRFIPGVG